MTLDATKLQALCPQITPDQIKQHVSRLDTSYVQCFKLPIIAQHLQRITQLSADQPAQLLLEPVPTEPAGLYTCTIISFDRRFEFALITGILAAKGFVIEKGEVFTLGLTQKANNPPAMSSPPNKTSPSLRRKLISNRRRTFTASASSLTPSSDPLHQRIVIDHFLGRFENVLTDFEKTKQDIDQAIQKVLGLLLRGDEPNITQAKRLVNEMVTQWLKIKPADPKQVLVPVQMTIEQIQNRCTRLVICAQDTPAFLYTLSNALSMHDLVIEHVQISSDQQQIQDRIDVVNTQGQPIDDQKLLDRVAMSVQLTKQFTYFLGSAPNPYIALERFEKLSQQIIRLPQRNQWLSTLSNPQSMQDLAKLLGTSDYLWENLMRSQYDALLPILEPKAHQNKPIAPPHETLPLLLEQAMASAVGLAQQRDRLNKFKDQQVFLIDLHHLLTPNADFRKLSSRLTHLAELLIARCAKCVYDDLVLSYGKPLLDQDHPVPWAIFGLGKLGGKALGFASDIELLFLYEDAQGSQNKTAGNKRDAITNTEFYEQFARETSQFIKTRHEGIFQVDLRLRPFGSHGPLASSVAQFKAYHQPLGKSHPFEKLALVRLRWIAGDAKLGYAIEQLRDQTLYEQSQLDLDELWDVWNKMHAQKDKPGQLNAKYSCGALADLEGTTQLLQVTHAGSIPQLRTASLTGAIESLHRAGVLSADHYAQLLGTYYFYRRLINALRILRGSAVDLFLPPAQSDQLTHLARRMGYTKQNDLTAGDQLLSEFQQRTTAIQQFIQTHFSRPCPGLAAH